MLSCIAPLRANPECSCDAACGVPLPGGELEERPSHYFNKELPSLACAEMQALAVTVRQIKLDASLYNTAHIEPEASPQLLLGRSLGTDAGDYFNRDAAGGLACPWSLVHCQSCLA